MNNFGAPFVNAQTGHGIFEDHVLRHRRPNVVLFVYVWFPLKLFGTKMYKRRPKMDKEKQPQKTDDGSKPVEA